MKCIRTKDGIYEVKKEYDIYYEVTIPESQLKYDEDNNCYYEESKWDAFLKKDVIKVADTIEELCDEFVFEMGLENNICQLTFEQVRDNILNCELYSMSTLYGAIWTDKGLIYVAKMNEKGYLELV
jgi:hypothetical protein